VNWLIVSDIGSELLGYKIGCRVVSSIKRSIRSVCDSETTCCSIEIYVTALALKFVYALLGPGLLVRWTKQVKLTIVELSTHAQIDRIHNKIPCTRAMVFSPRIFRSKMTSHV
jgi:hypothetical protein